jgi:hypothetical protein
MVAVAPKERNSNILHCSFVFFAYIFTSVTNASSKFPEAEGLTNLRSL